MATKTEPHALAAFEIANLMDDAADAMRKRGKRDFAAGRISLDEYVEARARELELRSEASVLVASDLGDALAGAAEAGANIERALVETRDRLEKIRSVQHAMNIVARLVALAGALVSGDVRRIVETGKALGKAS